VPWHLPGAAIFTGASLIHERRFGFLGRPVASPSPLWLGRAPDARLHQHKLLVRNPKAYSRRRHSGYPRSGLGIDQARRFRPHASAPSRWVPRCHQCAARALRATHAAGSSTKGAEKTHSEIGLFQGPGRHNIFRQESSCRNSYYRARHAKLTSDNHGRRQGGARPGSRSHLSPNRSKARLRTASNSRRVVLLSRIPGQNPDPTRSSCGRRLRVADGAFAQIYGQQAHGFRHWPSWSGSPCDTTRVVDRLSLANLPALLSDRACRFETRRPHHRRNSRIQRLQFMNCRSGGLTASPTWYPRAQDATFCRPCSRCQLALFETAALAGLRQVIGF